MFRNSTRLVTAVAAATAAAVLALAIAVPPAQAAVSGRLLGKGAGTPYSDWQALNLGVVPGGQVTFNHKVVNTGPTTEQFKLVLAHGSGTFTERMYQGSTAVANRYFTPPIAPGGYALVTVKATVPTSALQHSGYFTLELRDPDTNAVLDFSYGNVHVTKQTGTKRNDIYLKTGSQPYVGGSFTGQYENSQALNVGNTATFLLRLKNDGTTPSAIGLSGGTASLCPGNFTITVKQGTQNVTAAVNGGYYNTGTLAPGARKDLKVLIKLVSATPCGAVYSTFTSSGPDGPVQVNAQALVAD